MSYGRKMVWTDDEIQMLIETHESTSKHGHETGEAFWTTIKRRMRSTRSWKSIRTRARILGLKTKREHWLITKEERDGQKVKD